MLQLRHRNYHQTSVYYHMIKRLLLITFLLLFNVGCKPVYDTIMGYQNLNLTEITNVSFNDISYSTDNFYLQVKGTLTNNNNFTIHRLFYLECTFYTDSTFTTRIVDAWEKSGRVVEPGETVPWRIRYTNDAGVDYWAYPNLAVDDIKVYKEEQ